MMNLLTKAISYLGSLLKKTQVKNFLTAVMVGSILLTSGVASATNDSPSLDNVNKKVLFENNSERPTTTGEWNQKARETEDAPLERAKEIGKQSAQAVKEWGELYPDVVDRTVPDNLS